MEEAQSSGAKLLSMMVRCHYLYKYWFIRPSIEDVVKRYNEKHHPKLGTAGAAAGAELAAADGPTDSSSSRSGGSGSGAGGWCRPRSSNRRSTGCRCSCSPWRWSWSFPTLVAPQTPDLNHSNHPAPPVLSVSVMYRTSVNHLATPVLSVGLCDVSTFVPGHGVKYWLGYCEVGY